MKVAAAAAAILLCAVLAFYATLRLGLWSSDADALKARYAQPPSQFLTIDNVPLHVRIEGNGPVVVMLHGSLLNLHEWDPVVTRLRAHYRIVRLDWPPYGLSGPDPTGIYSTPRAATLLAGLVDRLGLARFVIVATSNGCNVALEYAARHPGHIKAMAFSILPLERPSQTRRMDWRVAWLQAIHRAILPHYHFAFWYRLILEDTTPPSYRPSPKLVQMIYRMDNLPGAEQRQTRFIQSNVALFRNGDVMAQAAKVRVPVLLQWCDYDTVISQSARRSVAAFADASVKLVTYPDLGHFPMLEQPARFSNDLGAFLDSVDKPSPPNPPH